MTKLIQYEVIERLQNLNTGIILIGEYKGMHKKHTFKCKNNHTWETSINHILYGQSGCPHCSNKAKLTTNKVIEKLKRLNTGITLVGEFKGVDKKNTFKCKNNHIWETVADYVLNKKTGCPYCSNNVKLTTKEVIERLEKLNKGITLIGEYKGVNKKHTFKCKNNHIWETVANVVINRKIGCPHCSNKAKLTTNDVIERLQNLNTGITLIGEFKGTKKKHTFKCKNNHTWETVANSVINMKSGCPYCSGRLM